MNGIKEASANVSKDPEAENSTDPCEAIAPIDKVGRWMRPYRRPYKTLVREGPKGPLHQPQSYRQTFLHSQIQNSQFNPILLFLPFYSEHWLCTPINGGLTKLR